MKTKAFLPLIELLIMLLVFSLAAALCLRAFVLSERLSAENEARDRAVTQAQNAAEILQYCGGDYAAAADTYGGVWDGTVWQIRYDSGWNMVSGESDYCLRAVPADSGHALLGCADISVTDTNGDCLFALPAAWQKEG